MDIAVGERYVLGPTVPVQRRNRSTPSAHMSIAGLAGMSSYGPCIISLVYGTIVYDRTYHMSH